MILDEISSRVEILTNILLSSDREAFLALLKCICGTGCLAMPKVFSAVGWLTGLIVTCVYGLILTHAMHILVGCPWRPISCVIP